MADRRNKAIAPYACGCDVQQTTANPAAYERIGS
jgi:hypothetical protein